MWKSKFVFGLIATAAVLIIAYAMFSGLNQAGAEKPASEDTNKTVKIGLPEFAQKTMRVEEAYIFAMMNQNKTMYLACYCGCASMQHSDKLIQHKSLKECYIRPDGSFEPHASECKLCNDIALEARGLLSEGYSLKEVRTIIDDRYGGRGVGTDTPLPP